MRVVVSIIFVLSTTAHSMLVGAKQETSWHSLLEQAERLSCDISYTKEGPVWPSDSAKQLARKALTLVTPMSQGADSASALILMCLGDYFMRDNSVILADSFWSAAATMAGRIQPSNSTLQRGLAWRQMILERERGNDAKADSLRSLALSDTSAEAIATNRVTYLHELAQVYTKLLRIQDNWRTHEQITQEWRENHLGDPRTVVIALMDLAEGASKILFTNVQSRYLAQDSAIQLGEEALHIARVHLGTDDASAGYVLNRLGDYYMRKGDKSRSEQYWNEAYDVNLAALPVEHIECQGSIQRLGSVAAANGDYSRAEKLLSLGVELRKKTQGEGHQEVASLINSLAGLYRQMGQFARAESLFVIALEIRRKALPPNHPDIATSLSALGRVCLDRAKAADAETYWRSALAIRETALGISNATTVSTMQDLAALYLAWGRRDEAEAMLNKSLNVKRQYLGEVHPEVAFGLLSLARLHVELQNLPAAHSEAIEALAILSVHGDSLNSDALMTIADIDRSDHCFDKADSLMCIVIRMIEQRQGPGSFRLLSPLTKHAEYLRDHGDAAQAEGVYRRAIAIAEAHEIAKSVRMVELLSSYAEFKQRSNDAFEAQNLLARAYETALIGFQDAVQVLPELKALRHAQQVRELRDKYIASLFDVQGRVAGGGNNAAYSQRSVAVSFDVLAIIFSDRAIVSTSLTRRRSELLQSKDHRVSLLIDSLKDTSLKLSRTYLENDSDTSFAKFDRRLKDLSARKLRLEESLAHLNHKIGADPNVLVLTPDQSRNLVNANTSFIQYVKYTPTPHDEPRYAAFVAHRRSLQAIDLGPAFSIDNLVDNYRRQMQRISELGEIPDSVSYREYLENGYSLIEAIWQPLESFLPGSGRVYVIPDGALNFLALGSLPGPRGSFLVERFEFTFLNSIRNLEGESGGTNDLPGLLALGDPDFRAAPSHPLTGMRPVSTAVASDSLPDDVIRGMPTNCRINRESLTPLVAARGEVERAGRLWQAAHAGPAIILVGDAASEENFKQLAPGSEVIHFATHAYLLGQDCLSKTLQEVTAANPLLQSGLLLAGAATPSQNNQSLSGEDGILTGEEIAAMDLRGTRCVVLSACESGLGTVSDGEGVYGLRRAFQLAGVETIVSSLWNVPDQSTARLMQRLYKSLRGGITSAVRSAQLASISELRAAGLPPHPYSWGAFVVVGK